MARRMLNNSISLSEQVDNLSDRAKVFFTWSIAHADDFGLLPCSIKKLKAMVAPQWNTDLQEIENIIKEILQQKLWVVIELVADQWFCFSKWYKYQTFKKDRNPSLYSDYKAKWEDYETIGKQKETSGNHWKPLETIGNQMEFQIKLNKIKLNPQGGSGGDFKKLKKSKAVQACTEAVDNLAKSDNTPSKLNTSGLKKSHNLKHSKVVGPNAFRQVYPASFDQKCVKPAEVRHVQVAKRQRKSVKSAEKQDASGGGKACSGSEKQRGIAIFKQDFPNGVGSLAELREAMKRYNLKPFCAGEQLSNNCERIQSANGQWRDFNGGFKAIELRERR